MRGGAGGGGRGGGGATIVYIQFTLTGHFKYWIGGQFLVPLDTSAA